MIRNVECMSWNFFIFGINAFENTQGNVTKLERQLDMVT